MELKINTKEWKLKNNKICGEYKISCGAVEVASKEFNDGYSSIEIKFSQDIMLKIEEVDKLIKSEIESYFKGEK